MAEYQEMQLRTKYYTLHTISGANTPPRNTKKRSLTAVFSPAGVYRKFYKFQITIIVFDNEVQVNIKLSPPLFLNIYTVADLCHAALTCYPRSNIENMTKLLFVDT